MENIETTTIKLNVNPQDLILKDFEFFKHEFKQIENIINENKTITLLIDYNKEFNYFSYNLMALFNCLEKDCIFSTTNEKELNKILKYLLNKNYYIVFDLITD